MRAPPKGQELLSRDRVLDSALKLFLENGYGNLSMEKVARDAHVSMRTIYRYFGNKAGLFGAVIRRCSDQFADSLPEFGEPQQALQEFARHFITRITRSDVVRIRTILIGESLRFPELAAQFYEQGPQRTLDQLTDFFARQQRTGHFSGFDPQRLADHFLSCLRNERFHKLQLGLAPIPDDAEIETWVRQAVEVFLHGCLSGKR
nr:TetR/AcrR family transcriptional regulator [Methylomarinum sp. Ch1-1]MDP4519696.1 TetR/AcrR family transcriptional regulator [Methylomarinum sp. Ch1-1]